MEKTTTVSLLLSTAALLAFSSPGKGAPVRALNEDGKEVPISTIAAHKIAGGYELASSYANDGVLCVVPGMDTVGDNAWWHRPFIPNDPSLANAFSLEANGAISLEFSVGFYNDEGQRIAYSRNQQAAFDVAFYKDAGRSDESQIARLRIWTDTGGGLNGDHSYEIYTNDWTNRGSDKWIVGDATLSSHFYIQLDKENYLSSYVGGSEELTPLVKASEMTRCKNMLNGVDQVYVSFIGDNGFAKQTSTLIRSINGQSLANDGTNFIDTEAPVFLASNVQATIPANVEYEIPTEAFDLLSGVSYSLQIGDQTIPGKKFTPTEIGSLDVNLIATDGVGNSRTKTYTFEISDAIPAPSFLSLPTIAGGEIEPLSTLTFDMPTIQDATGTATVVLHMYHGEDLVTTLRKNANDQFSYNVPASFEPGQYTFIYEATNTSGSTRSEVINVTYAMRAMNIASFVGLPDDRSLAVYEERGIKCETISNWVTFSLGVFDITEGLDLKFIVDDAANMENAAVAMRLVNADNNAYTTEYRVWTSFSNADRPTNVYITTNNWGSVNDITDTGWIKRGVDEVPNQYHMAYSAEDTFVGERLGGMTRVDRAYNALKAFFAAAPSNRFEVSLALGRNGGTRLSATITEFNGQSFASPIVWQDAYLALKSTIPAAVEAGSSLEIEAYAKDLRRSCDIHLGGTDADGNAISEDFVDSKVTYAFPKVGNYHFVISTVGENGNEVKIERDVVCKSTTQELSVTVNGSYAATYEMGEEITILPATYSDNVVTHSVTVYGPSGNGEAVEEGATYRLAKPGIYRIVYLAMDEAEPTPNKATKEFVINVPDVEAPIIQITIGEDFEVGDEISFTITIIDDCDSIGLSVSLKRPKSSAFEDLTGGPIYKFTASEEGVYVIRITANDLYDNMAIHEETFEVSKAASGGCFGSFSATLTVLAISSLAGLALSIAKKKER